ncbi:MAG TPA: hypothetical protein VF505_13330 [Thermoanaerobaculia bacterium]
MTVLRRALAALIVTFLAGAASAATIAEEIAAVEKIRGLKFTAPVNTVEIDRKDLPAHLRRQFEKSLPYSIEDWGDVMRALRLIDEKDTDEAIVSSLLDLYQSQVLAYYDPPSKTFYTIRQLPEALQSLPMSGMLDAGINVHELTHALQDQHFQIGDRDEALRDDTDANLAYHALIEGEASLVMLAYMIEKNGGSFDEMINSDLLGGVLSAAATQTLPGGGPRYFTEMLKFPYLDGLKFVIEGYRRGGWKELDKVYANPPRSSREILHPLDYFDHRFTPLPFNDKPALPVFHLLSVEHLGEFHWRLLAGEAGGWKADRVTIAQNRFCETTVLAETQWETTAAAQRFYDAYTHTLDDVGYLARIDGTTVRVAYGADRPLMEHFVKP